MDREGVAIAGVQYGVAVMAAAVLNVVVTSDPSSLFFKVAGSVAVIVVRGYRRSEGMAFSRLQEIGVAVLASVGAVVVFPVAVIYLLVARIF